jgi:hypothetical protein
VSNDPALNWLKIISATGGLLSTSGLRAARFFLNPFISTLMAIKLRLTGTVSDAPRSLTYTISGMPRFNFGVRVGGIRKRTYRITAYGSTARFGDHHLRSGDRVQVEGAFLRRRRATAEELVRADTIRHVGNSLPPSAGTPVRFVPEDPPRGGTLRTVPSAHEYGTGKRSHDFAAEVDDAIAAALG